MLVVDYPTPSKIDLGHVLNIFQLIFLSDLARSFFAGTRKILLQSSPIYLGLFSIKNPNISSTLININSKLLHFRSNLKSLGEFNKSFFRMYHYLTFAATYTFCFCWVVVVALLVLCFSRRRKCVCESEDEQK
jgi:hypothetical protein